MRGLGISIYSNKGTVEEIQKYIELAGGYGFTRGGTCLISEQYRTVEDFKKIVLDEFHFNRGDVLIESNIYTRYAGALQVALKNMDDSGKTNVVAKIVPEELFLLDYLEPWEKFRFKEKNK